jgi:hypothetical protein
VVREVATAERSAVKNVIGVGDHRDHARNLSRRNRLLEIRIDLGGVGETLRAGMQRRERDDGNCNYEA